MMQQLQSPLDISSLDPFIVTRVLSYFTAVDVVTSGQVCHKWNSISLTPSLWYQLYLRDFGNYSSSSSPPLESADWKKKYAFATSIYILRNFTLGDNNNKAQKMCWIGMMLTKQDKSYLSAISRYPLLGEVICMSVVDLKPQPLYENPIKIIDGLCFTYSVHERESYDTLKANIAQKKDVIKDKNVAIIALTYPNQIFLLYTDVPGVISTEEGRKLAQQIHAEFYEVNLRSYAGLDESFIYLLENINKTKPLHVCKEDSDSMVIRKKKKKGDKCIIS